MWNTSYYQLVESYGFISVYPNGFYSRNCSQIGLLRRINKRFLVLKAMKQRIGKLYNSYVLKNAFEFLFPQQND